MEIRNEIKNLNNHKIFIEVKKLIEYFLQKEGYLAVDVPLLSPVLIPESYLEIFKTENLYQSKERLYLTPSPELFLKRLIVNGIGSCYFLGKSFRNKEPNSLKHSHEFTMLEFYKVNASYFDVAEDVMKMLRFIAKGLFGKEEIKYQNKIISLKDYEKITVAEAFLKYAGINNIFNYKDFFKQAKEKGYRVDGMNYVDVWSQIYGIEIESKLGTNGKPTIIYEYPRELAAITQVNEEKNVAERFEIYIEGIELGNCGNEATENTNMVEHRKRFENDVEIRKNLGMINYKPDNEFLSVLEALPKSSGIAIGVDRLAMIYADVKSIQDLRLIQIL